MRTSSGNNPHVQGAGDEYPGRPTDWKLYAAHERAAVTHEDVVDFLRDLAALEAAGKKATGNSGALPSGTFVEHARQIARKAGWAHIITGKGWLLTINGRSIIVAEDKKKGNA